MFEELKIYSWTLEGKFVQATYIGEFVVFGEVTQSRVAYGGGTRHTIKLAEPLEVYGRVTDTVIVKGDEITNVYRVKKEA